MYLRKVVSTDHSIARSIFMTVSGLSLLLFGGHSHSIDEETYLASLRAFLHLKPQIDLSVTPPEILVATPGKGGALTSIYGFGTILFYLPMYLVGKCFAFIVSSPWKEQTLRLFFYSSNSLALGATSATIYLIGRSFRCNFKVCCGGALSYGIGSYALAHAGTGFSEPLTAMFITLSFYFLVRIRGGATYAAELSAAMLGAAMLMRPSSLIFVPLFYINLLVSSRRDRWFFLTTKLVIGGTIPIAVMLTSNWWKWGSLFDTGYPKLAYNTPWYEGVYGLFLSSGKGLVWFAPVTVVAFIFVRQGVQRFRADVLVLWACVIVNTALFCRFEVWSGDDAYGPRYMGIVLPLIVVLAILGSDGMNQRAIWIAGLCGLPASIAGSLIYVNASNSNRIQKIFDLVGSSSRFEDGTFDWTRTRRAVNFTPRLSQLIEHLGNIPDAFRESLRSVSHHSAPFLIDTKSSLSWYISRVRLDLWWLYWIETGASVWILGLLLLPIAMIACGGKDLRSRLKSRN